MKFAKMDEIVLGTKLVCDGGFTCMLEGDVKEVVQNKRGEFYISCDKGFHALHGQLNDEGSLVGLSLLKGGGIG